MFRRIALRFRALLHATARAMCVPKIRRNPGQTLDVARSLGRPPSRDLDVVEMLRIMTPLALWTHETSPQVRLYSSGLAGIAAALTRVGDVGYNISSLE